MKANLDSPAVRKRLEEDERSGADFSTNPMARGNEDFVQNQQQQSKRMIEQQDASLESLGVAVDRLGAIGKDIHDEVKEQNSLLDSLGNEVDDAGNKMNVVTASLSKLLQTKDGCQIWTIVILTFILILLSKYSILFACTCAAAEVCCALTQKLTALCFLFLPSFSQLRWSSGVKSLHYDSWKRGECCSFFAVFSRDPHTDACIYAVTRLHLLPAGCMLI